MQSDTRSVVFIILIVLIVAILALLWGVEEEKPFSWKSSYSCKDKSPYGNYILFERLQDIFPNQNIEKTQVTVYENYQNIEEDLNYIFIDTSFDPNPTDSEVLLDFVDYGGCLFVAAEHFGELVRDSLRVYTKLHYLFKNEDSLGINFSNKQAKSKYSYTYKRNTVNTYFSDYPKQAKVLARNTKKKAVLLLLNYGDGKIILSSTPKAFTNYNLLRDNNKDFVAKSLSFLPVRDVYWDEYYKIGRGVNANQFTAPFTFVWTRRSFRSAILLTLATIIIFVIFEARRKQRIIPIVEPLKNTTLEFVEVIGRLYFLKRNHHDIALKKVSYFLDYVRTNFFLKTHQFDDIFIENLAVKSHNDKKRVKQLFGLIEHIQKKNTLSQEELLELNFRIDRFKKNTNTQKSFAQEQ